MTRETATGDMVFFHYRCVCVCMRIALYCSLWSSHLVDLHRRVSSICVSRLILLPLSIGRCFSLPLLLPPQIEECATYARERVRASVCVCICLMTDSRLSFRWNDEGYDGGKSGVLWWVNDDDGCAGTSVCQLNIAFFILGICSRLERVMDGC